jgi:aspartyl-tRNA(Asn)/glutamyl-tRNA(Gln) amidotransferase subunit A
MFKATRHDGFGAEVKRRVLIGTYALSAGYYDAYYVKAQKARTLIRRDFERAFGEVDALVGPVTPHVAFPLGERVDDPVAMYQSDVYTIGVNLAGLPGLVVPCGFEAVADLPGGRDATRPFRPGQALLEPPPPSSVGPRLPVGLQLIGPALAEGRLLGIGHAFQQATSFHLQRPALEAPVR